MRGSSMFDTLNFLHSPVPLDGCPEPDTANRECQQLFLQESVQFLFKFINYLLAIIRALGWSN